MKDYPLLFASFILIFLLGLMHFVADKLYLYWSVWWFDNVMHFLGGLSLGMFAVWIVHVSGVMGRHIPTKKSLFLTTFVAVFFIGIGWEIFEYANGLTQATEDVYALDVAHDLVADLFGAFIAGIVTRWKGFYITKA